MLAKFDPIRERQVWLDFCLNIDTEFAPERIPPTVQPSYASQIVNSLIETYWIGMSSEVHPTLERIIGWMEARSEPRSAAYSWQRTLGLCKWLRRNDSGEGHFLAALDAKLQRWQQAIGAQDHEERQEALSECLATALTANNPAVGLKLYEAAKVKRPSDDQAPLLRFGRWACE